MSYLADPWRRGPAAAAAIAVQAVLAWALFAGLAGRMIAPGAEHSTIVSIAIPPRSPQPPPAAPPPASGRGRPAQAEGSAGRRAKATAIVAPRPPLMLAPRPPVVTSEIAGQGAQASNGAADAGAGAGAGGAGSGLGGGGSGGSGGGFGGGPGGGTAAQRVAGGLRDSDYPAAAARTRAAGTVFIRIRVGVDGRVRGCEVAGSSGNPVLDETTCRLVAKRFRYRPARDAAGREVESVEATNFTWGPRLP